jgi:hypothetical protein
MDEMKASSVKSSKDFGAVGIPWSDDSSEILFSLKPPLRHLQQWW